MGLYNVSVYGLLAHNEEDEALLIAALLALRGVMPS